MGNSCFSLVASVSERSSNNQNEKVAFSEPSRCLLPHQIKLKPPQTQVITNNPFLHVPHLRECQDQVLVFCSSRFMHFPINVLESPLLRSELLRWRTEILNLLRAPSPFFFSPELSRSWLWDIVVKKQKQKLRHICLCNRELSSMIWLELNPAHCL